MMKNVLKKFMAVLLIAAVLVSSAAFGASAASGTIEVTMKITGTGSIWDQNDDELLDKGTYTYPVGEKVTLTAYPENEWDYQFLYWINTETDRVVSFEEEYSFYAATYANLEAVFDDSEDVLAGNNTHRVVYLTSGDNILFSKVLDVGDTAYFDEIRTDIEVGDNQLVDWDHSIEEVAASTENCFVHPNFVNNNTCTITTIIGNDSYSRQVAFGTTVAIKAPDMDARFSCWMVPEDPDDPYDADTIVSYEQNYTFVATLDQTIMAVYGDQKGNGIATRISGDLPNFTDSSITFYAEHSVIEDNYEVLQHGLIMTSDLVIGNNPDLFIINSKEKKIQKGTSKNTDFSGTYSVKKTKWHDTMESGGETVDYYPLLFVRSYVIVEDYNTGETLTVYSPIYVADYVNVGFKGILEGSNYDDPFAETLVDA